MMNPDVNIARTNSFGDIMRRIVLLVLALALGVASTIPANAQRENTKIGENQREAKRAAKQQKKYSKKTAKQQRKAMKRDQKAQRKAAKQQSHHKL
jgi:uncharacterized protein HemX